MILIAAEQAGEQVATGDAITRWLLIAAAVLATFATLSKRGRELLASIRQASSEKDDADIAQLNRKVTNLARLLEEEQETAEAYRKTCAELYGFILAAQRDPSRLSAPVPEPPRVHRRIS